MGGDVQAWRMSKGGYGCKGVKGVQVWVGM